MQYILAQAVEENEKCSGCFHYDPQHGQTGVCVIGLRPWLCGEGEAPAVGYHPIAMISAEHPGNVAPVAQVSTPSESPNIPMRLVILGEEKAQVVKSLIAKQQTWIRSNCPLHHQLSKAIGDRSPHVVADLACSCRPLSLKAVARELVPTLTNAERTILKAEDVVSFVGGIAEHKDLDVFTRHELKKCMAMAGEDSWLGKFRGTELFDAAVALQEEELDNEQENLKRRRESYKQRTPPSPVDDGEIWLKNDEIRLKKRRLDLKLATVREKALKKQRA